MYSLDKSKISNRPFFAGGKRFWFKVSLNLFGRSPGALTQRKETIFKWNENTNVELHPPCPIPSALLSLWMTLIPVSGGLSLNSRSAFPTLAGLARQWVASVQFSRSVMSDSLQPRGLQCPRFPCLSPTPRACSNSCLLSRWCHPTISSSVIPVSSRLQFFPASRSFPVMGNLLSPNCMCLPLNSTLPFGRASPPDFLVSPDGINYCNQAGCYGALLGETCPCPLLSSCL